VFRNEDRYISVPVDRIDFNGVVVHYKSIKEAALDLQKEVRCGKLGTRLDSIFAVLRGAQKIAYGFLWKRRAG